MKNSTKTLIIIIAIVIILPIIIAIHCRYRVQAGDYDHKFVAFQTDIIPNIHTLELDAIPKNKLSVFADGSGKDTLCYLYSANWKYGFSERDSIPRFSVQNGILKIENKFVEDTTVENNVQYNFGVKNLNKILVNQSKLYYYNSSKDCSPNINIEISNNGQCVVGAVYEMRKLKDFNKNIPDSNMLRQYKNMNIHIKNGEFEIKDYTNIDTLRIHAIDDGARITIGNTVRIKYIEGELKSMSFVKGNFENMELFKQIVSKEM